MYIFFCICICIPGVLKSRKNIALKVLAITLFNVVSLCVNFVTVGNFYYEKIL
jgi:hypothetical protein